MGNNFKSKDGIYMEGRPYMFVVTGSGNVNEIKPDEFCKYNINEMYVSGLAACNSGIKQQELIIQNLEVMLDNARNKVSRLESSQYCAPYLKK